MTDLTDDQEAEIEYIRDNHHKFGLVCKNIKLLLACYEELERERTRSEQLKFLCDVCKERGG